MERLDSRDSLAERVSGYTMLNGGIVNGEVLRDLLAQKPVDLPSGDTLPKPVGLGVLVDGYWEAL